MIKKFKRKCDLNQNIKLKESMPVSNLLNTAINRYQFDVVGWTNIVLKIKL